MRTLLAAGALAWGSFAAAGAQSVYTSAPDVPVPDGNASGVVSVLEVPASTGRILDVDLTLTLSGREFGGWNGDLYVLLSHNGVASVLANRPGFVSGDAFGYGDNGLFEVRFDDEAVLGDFHLYQDLLGAAGDSILPVTGSWQPDGRATDPDVVLETDPRTLLLDVFDGAEAGGEWVLFVADLSRGATLQLKSWELHLRTDDLLVIPEPATGIGLACGVLMAMGGFEAWRRRRSARG